MPPAPVSVTSPSSRPPPRPRENSNPPRQVHFSGEGSAKVPVTTSGPPKNKPQLDGSNEERRPSSSNHQPPHEKRPQQTQEVPKQPEQESTQPQAFPGIGHFPGASQPGLQWHRSAVPGQSLSAGYQGPGNHLHVNHNTHGAPPGFTPSHNGHFSPIAPQVPTHTAPPGPTTYIGRQHQQPPPGNMGDYQNTAPPTRGQCFQPPVPDTTFGPMYHVYTPRFDPPGMVPAGPMGHQPVQFLPVPSFYVQTEPQAFFTPNYAYDASAPARVLHFISVMGFQVVALLDLPFFR